MFEFVNCRADKRFDTTCWYVVLGADDQCAFEKIHKAVCVMLFKKFDQDPHVNKAPEFGTFNMAHLGGLWCQGLERMFSEFGAVFVGSAGGFREPCKDTEILARASSQYLKWPDINTRVTVSQWPEGTHWYISSAANFLISPNRFSTRRGAEKYANMLSSKVSVSERAAATRKDGE